LQKEQTHFIIEWVKYHKKSVLLIFVFITCLGFLEVSIALLVHVFVKKFSVQLDRSELVISLVVLALFLLVYMVISFFNIKRQRQYIISFINELRRQWLILILNKKIFSLSGEDKGKFLAKISYHFSLLQMGLSHSLFSCFQWIVLNCSLFIMTFFINPYLFLFSVAMLPVNLMLAYVGFILSRYYMSREQTLHSRLLRFISNTFEEFIFIKWHRQEGQTLKALDQLVELDTYFRVRRELWAQYGSHVLFAMLSVASVAFLLFQMYNPLFEIESNHSYLVYGIVIGLEVKLIYLSLNIGLFLYPLKLGLVLSVSEDFPVRPEKNEAVHCLKKIVFKSQKVRLSRTGNYFKNLVFEFAKGNRILITGEPGCGKTSLGYILSALAHQNVGCPWIVIADGQRLSYKHWQNRHPHVYMIDPFFNTQTSLIDLFGSTEEGVSPSAEKINALIAELKKYPEIEFIFDYPKILATQIRQSRFAFVDLCLLQMAYCLLQKPEMVVIDNHWLDLQDGRVNAMIQCLGRHLPNSILAVLSTKPNGLLVYDKIYSL